jgi:hypothetical protein
MSIRWMLVAIAAFLVTDCGSSNDSDGPGNCEAGYTSKEICTACGPAGGCGHTETKCTRICTTGTDCQGPLMLCLEGVCQVGGCI